MRRCLFFLCSAGALAAQVAAPRLAISLNESSAMAIFPGWPVLAQVSIVNDSRQAALRLAPWRGTWPQAIRLVVTGPSGSIEDWKFERSADAPDPALTLPARSRTSAFLVLDSEKTANLAAGAYAVTAELEIGGSEGWNGLVRSPAVRLVVQEPAALTPDQETELALLRAGVALLRQQNDQAKQILSDYLDANPRVVPALRMMAEVLEDEGDLARAYLYAALAAKSYGENQAGAGARSEPPGQLLSLRDRLWRKMLETSQ